MLLLPIAVVYGFVYFFLAQTTVRALHVIGIGLTVAVLGSIVWVLVDIGVLVLSGPGDFATLLLYMFGALLTVGMCWTPIWTLLTGQVAVDAVDRA